MILTLTNNKFIELLYPFIDYYIWGGLKDCKNDNDVVDELNGIIKELDCRKEYDGKRILMTEWPKYKIRLSFYYYYILKLKNQFLYNKYIDKLIEIHSNNVDYENNFPYIVESKKKSKRKAAIKRRKIISKDLFSDNMMDITNDNNIKPLESYVPLDHMTYSFKKKQNE